MSKHLTPPAWWGAPKKFNLALFHAYISVMMGMLVYPVEIKTIYKKVRKSLFATALIFAFFTPVAFQLTPTYLLLTILIILTSEIAYLNSLYYRSIIEPRTEE